MGGFLPKGNEARSCARGVFPQCAVPAGLKVGFVVSTMPRFELVELIAASAGSFQHLI
jgi:hypothetical protein